jgi:hypothetical protein
MSTFKHTHIHTHIAVPQQERQPTVTIGDISRLPRDKGINHIPQRRQGLCVCVYVCVYDVCMLQNNNKNTKKKNNTHTHTYTHTHTHTRLVDGTSFLEPLACGPRGRLSFRPCEINKVEGGATGAGDPIDEVHLARFEDDGEDGVGAGGFAFVGFLF